MRDLRLRMDLWGIKFYIEFVKGLRQWAFEIVVLGVNSDQLSIWLKSANKSLRFSTRLGVGTLRVL
jgi:hypothetical protein